MSAFTEADVERLVDIISEAQKRGIKHGSYTLARWILTAWSVEGSTPIASPAQCGHGIAVAGAWLRCQNTPDHDGLHISGRRRWRTGGTLEPADPPARQCGMHYSWPSDGIVPARSVGPCLRVGEHNWHRDEDGYAWPAGWTSATIPVVNMKTSTVIKGAPLPADAPAGEVVSVPPPVGPTAIPLSQAIAKACAESPEFAAAYAKANAPAVNCVYDVWGADFGVQAGARCANADPVHQAVHHADTPVPVPHPESYCHRCGGPNVVWSAPSPLWNAVMRGGSVNGVDEHDGIVCPTCFGQIAEKRGIARLWRLDAEVVTAEVETVTPSGRVWDSAAWRWHEPLATGGIITNPPLLLVAEPEAGCTLTVPPPVADRSPSLAAPVAAAYGAPADEPAPVPPPVDALLNLVDDLHSAVRDDDSTGIDRARGNIVMAVRALYAAGVEKGRRQATEERTEEQLAAAVTVKGCLGVDRGHGKSDVHYWRCPTPECAGHLCRKDGLAEGAILDGRRTIEPDETVSHD